MFLTNYERNPYYTAPLSQEETAAGPRPTIGESFGAEVRSASMLSSMYGDADLFQRRYQENLDMVESLTGEKMSSATFEYEGYRNIIKSIEGEDQSLFAHINPSFYKSMAEQEAKLNELKKQYPQIKNQAEVWQDTKTHAAQMEAEVEKIRERQGLGGAIAGFVGGAAGSFSMSDPINVGSVAYSPLRAVNGFAKTVGIRILSEAAENSIAEGINQFTGVAESRRRLGLREYTTGEKVSQVAMAGVGAGVIRGGIEAAPYAAKAVSGAYRSLESSILPNAAMKRELNKALSPIMSDIESGVPAAKPASFSDDEFLTYLKHSAPKTDEVRAAIYSLETQIEFKRNLPFHGVDKPAYYAEYKMQELLNEYEGLPPPDLNTSSSAKALLGDSLDRDPIIYIPEFRKAYEDQARLKSPDVFNRLDNIEAKITELENVVQDASSAIENRTMADAVGAVDEASGQRVRQIESELESKNIPKKKRQDLERELDVIVETLGENNIRKADSDYTIAPSKELRRNRKSLQALKKERNALRRETDALVENELNASRTSANLERMAKGQTEAKKFNEPIAVEPAKITEKDVIKDVPVFAQSLYEKAIKPNDAGKEGYITLGGMDIPEDFKVSVMSVLGDEGEEAVSKSVREILDDLAEDDKLIKAMTVCGI